MSDIQRDLGRDDADRLPWLEPVDAYEEEGSISLTRLIGAVVVGLVALGLVIGGIFWLRNGDTAEGDGTLIEAPDGPIKTRPEEAGGMAVEGTGDVAYPASVGREVDSAIDLSALPENPVVESPGVRPAAVQQPIKTVDLPASRVQAPIVEAKPKPAPAAAPQKAPVRTAAPAGAPASISAAGSIQLGAFSTPAAAQKAWKLLASRFAFLGELDHGVVPVRVEEKTLYRLRAGAGSEAGTICAKLKVAGEACTVVN